MSATALYLDCGVKVIVFDGGIKPKEGKPFVRLHYPVSSTIQPKSINCINFKLTFRLDDGMCGVCFQALPDKRINVKVCAFNKKSQRADGSLRVLFKNEASMPVKIEKGQLFANIYFIPYRDLNNRHHVDKMYKLLGVSVVDRIVQAVDNGWHMCNFKKFIKRGNEPIDFNEKIFYVCKHQRKCVDNCFVKPINIIK